MFHDGNEMIVLDPLWGKLPIEKGPMLNYYTPGGEGSWLYGQADPYTTCVLCRKGEGVIASGDFEELLKLK